MKICWPAPSRAEADRGDSPGFLVAAAGVSFGIDREERFRSTPVLVNPSYWVSVLSIEENRSQSGIATDNWEENEGMNE